MVQKVSEEGTNGAILETAQVSSRPKAVCEHVQAEQGRQGNHHGLEMWNWVQATLSSEHERQRAYLLYHCRLSPEEIVRLRHTLYRATFAQCEPPDLPARAMSREMQ